MVKVIYNNVLVWDNRLCLKIFNLNGRRIIDYIMYLFSRAGDGYLYAAAGIVFLLIGSHSSMNALYAAMIAFALEVSLHTLLKHKTKRNRPFEKIENIKFLIAPPDKFSFPSGHTAAAFLMAAVTSQFFPQLTIPLFILAGLVGFSRIYNGLHYPSDVLAGMTLGLICANIGITIII